MYPFDLTTSLDARELWEGLASLRYKQYNSSQGLLSHDQVPTHQTWLLEVCNAGNVGNVCYAGIVCNARNVCNAGNIGENQLLQGVGNDNPPSPK